MKNDSDVGSILMADVGSIGTKAALFDLVDGTYRFIAAGKSATSVHPSQPDVGLGLQRAIRQIETTTGRRLVGDEGILCPEMPDGTGVDLFGMATSCRRPLKVMAVGLVDDSAFLSSLQELYSPSFDYVDQLSWPGPNTQNVTPLSNLIQRISACQPDVILLICGSNPDDHEILAELGNALASIRYAQGTPGIVAVSGNKSCSESIGNRLQGKYTVRYADDLLTGAEARISLKQCLTEIWSENTLSLPWFSRVRSWTLLPTSYGPLGLSLVVRFLSALYKKDVWCFDVGANTTSVFASVQGDFLSVIKEGVGVGGGATGLLDSAGNMAKWLPDEMSASAIRDFLMNKRRRPWTVPESSHDMLMEVAMAREAVKIAMGNDSPESGVVRPVLSGGLVIGCGAVICGGNSAVTAGLNLLDILEPVGVFELAVDELSLLSMLGGLGASFPVAATDAILTDGLHRLGTCVAPDGTIGEKTDVVSVVVDRADGRRQEVSVPFGTIQTIPLGAKEEATLQVQPHKNFDVGDGKGRSVGLRVRGGSLGIIIDARGRPLSVSNATGDLRTQMAKWRAGLEGKQ